MKVAFLHTLTANQTLFDACIQESPLTEIADVIHRNAPELLQYASSVGLDDTLAKQVEQHILNLEEQGAEWIICTCSSIGHLAESSKTGSAQVIRVDRPMALAASQANGITVLAALKTTIEPTMNLLAEYQADIQQLAKVRVIDDAWQHYLDGCSERYQQTIADYIEQHCLEDDSIVLAQASMAPAVKRLPEALQHKVLTSPELCIQYLIVQLAGE
ncbi:hypothetical protein J7438_21395 [Thalassotalea sp. G20_0]|uniref:hypothetical protein n=1 Tax=Thalassotalea sp. G20_0 TaxID=2821093 RepID=UPI001ADCD8D3|nr:hypothetical protein [Thalassotalea sp. G20_0]MBO9496619.1 hypothetical protein [Thalassotalea sp. G20_0]